MHKHSLPVKIVTKQGRKGITFIAMIKHFIIVLSNNDIDLLISNKLLVLILIKKNTNERQTLTLDESISNPCFESQLD